MSDAALRELAESRGVLTAFNDLHGTRHEAPPETLRALLRALGVPAGSEAELREALEASAAPRRLPEERVVVAGAGLSLAVGAEFDWAVIEEGGAVLAEGHATGVLAVPDLAVGYHRLVASGAGWHEEMRLLCRPARVPGLADRTGRAATWGVNAALYGFRSGQNGGLGSYADLAAAARVLGGKGADFLGINPVHALGWATAEIISPYSPSHRAFLNIDHVAVAGGLGPASDAALLDYPGFRARHRAALAAQFLAERGDAAFRGWLAKAEPELSAFAAFEALSEIHGQDFRRWPAALRSPEGALAAGVPERAAFHAWLQWQARRQIEAAHAAALGAGMGVGLYLDLAVGPRPDGAEVWLNADTIARGVTIGAPPDYLNPEGQSWALAAYAPGPLAAAQYRPLRLLLSRLMSTCGILRIDHALGLMRSFWLPDDGSPGGYIRQPLDSLMAVIAIEAQRAGCLIVGEDLGLVPDGLRERMLESGFYRYTVWQFESDDAGGLCAPGAMAAQSLACFGTHDTPTLQGFWYGKDVEAWAAVGWIGSGEVAARHGRRARQRQSLRRLCGLAPDAAPAEITDAIHRELAGSPAELVSVQLDDALGLLDAQNLPGTIDEHPNWRRRLPVTVDELATAPGLDRIAATLNTAREPAPPLKARRTP